LRKWSTGNRKYKTEIAGEFAPDENEEYLLYQTLLGAWPFEPYTAEEYGTFVERIQAYMLKALHEAKVHTSWINPNPAYDAAVQQYVAQILAAQTNGAFLNDFRAFQRRISHYGLFNALSQTLLRITAPGVPDTYQGTEVWDFSLVDPDNRRPVDYVRRHHMLQELQSRMEAVGDNRVTLAQEILSSPEDGRIKLYVTSLALNCRRTHRGLFSAGDYLPVQGAGAKREYILAFSRRHGDREAMVAVPRLIARLLANGHQAPVGEAVWQDTRLLVPGIDPHRAWRNVLTGEVVTFTEEDGQPMLAVAQLLAHFPVALLVASE
jgi:(1->4)-alpha-D-glucan 1-alpha-D-glucosylmutase